MAEDRSARNRWIQQRHPRTAFRADLSPLHSLELGRVEAWPDAAITFISLFPNLDDLQVDAISSTLASPAQRWAACGIKHSPSLSGTLRFSVTGHANKAKMFVSIAPLSPRFRVVGNPRCDHTTELGHRARVVRGLCRDGGVGAAGVVVRRWDGVASVPAISFRY